MKEELSSEMVFKDSQKFKWGEKGHARRGTQKHRHTDKCRSHQNAACHEPSLEIKTNEKGSAAHPWILKSGR